MLAPVENPSGKGAIQQGTVSDAWKILWEDCETCGNAVLWKDGVMCERKKTAGWNAGKEEKQL